MKTFLLLAGVLAAGEFAQLPSLRPLHESILSEPAGPKRQAALERLTRTAPRGADDLRWLFDLFMRLPDPEVRSAVVGSLDLIDPQSAQLEQGLLQYLRLPEPEARLFGIKGLARLKSAGAARAVRPIAERRMSAATPDELSLANDRNEWWVQVEALDAIAAIDGEKARPLIARQAEKAPRVARVLASRYWEKTLPQLSVWSRKDSRAAQLEEALKASVPYEDLRRTRAQMLAVVRDPKAQPDLRHQLALKAGLVSKPEEVAELLKEHEASQDETTRKFLAAALFASRDPQTVPFLKVYAAEHPDPRTRMGSLVQLLDMLPPAEAKTLLEAAAQSEKDAQNRADIQDLLRKL